MDFESVYKNKPYLFEIGKDDVGGGDEIVEHLMSQTLIGKPDSIKFLCSNYEYDSYLVTKDGIGYCVKYSFDAANISLKNESKILHQNHPACPRPIVYEKIKFGDEIHYSICSFEFADNVKDFGFASLLENWESFFDVYNRSQKAFCEMYFSDYLNDFYQKTNILSFPDDALESIKKYYNFDILQELIKSVVSEINVLSKPSLVKRKELCHGKLQPSNILFRRNMFKLIDFTQSYHGNEYLDLSRLAIFLGLNSVQEKEMLTASLKSKNQTFTKELWEEYRSCYDVMIRMIFVELIVSYLKEVYIFSSFRPIKILSIIEVFSKNNKAFFRLPVINQHYEFIYKMMLEPIIGKE
jgi:hypothetical protein